MISKETPDDLQGLHDYLADLDADVVKISHARKSSK